MTKERIMIAISENTKRHIEELYAFDVGYNKTKFEDIPEHKLSSIIEKCVENYKRVIGGVSKMLDMLEDGGKY